jgi:hypothetical protein
MMNGDDVMNNREIAMYGMTQADIEKNYMNSVTGLLSGQEMVVMSILSDCQEMIGAGGASGLNPRMEEVRQQLNVAKYILSEMMDAKRSR